MTDKTPRINKGATQPLSLQRTLESLAYHLRPLKKHDAAILAESITRLCDAPTGETVSKHLQILALVIGRDANTEPRPKAKVFNLHGARACPKHNGGAA